MRGLLKPPESLSSSFSRTVVEILGLFLLLDILSGLSLTLPHFHSFLPSASVRPSVRPSGLPSVHGTRLSGQREVGVDKGLVRPPAHIHTFICAQQSVRPSVRPSVCSSSLRRWVGRSPNESCFLRRSLTSPPSTTMARWPEETARPTDRPRPSTKSLARRRRRGRTCALVDL